MTSDTKIGLLLGLVFIFVIAFLINGLPSFQSKAEATGTTNTESFVHRQQHRGNGVATQARQVQTYFDPQSRLPETVAENAVFNRSLPTGFVESIRDQRQLPKRVSLLERDAMQGVSEVKKNLGLVIASPEGPRTPKTVFHRVEENENLAVIAKRYYGGDAGNRRANLNRIFEANRDQLDSPDQIRVGQRLVIPPLRDNSALGDVFVPVPAKPRRPKQSKPSPVIAKQKPKDYRVQEGDSLWKIAAKVLGNGSRYQDIIRLNRDRLANEDSLTVGTRLRLPSN